MKQLKILSANFESGIDQNGIYGLDLIELYVDDNEKITNVSFMKNLKILSASFKSGIDQNGIYDLDLIEL
jgi:hypothetical protein